MTEKENIPAYEALESNIDDIEQLAASCSRMINGCVDTYVPASKTARVEKDLECIPDPMTIIDRLNNRVDSINQYLISIRASGVMLENEIPRTISGKGAVVSDECTTG